MIRKNSLNNIKSSNRWQFLVALHIFVYDFSWAECLTAHSAYARDIKVVSLHRIDDDWSQLSNSLVNIKFFGGVFTFTYDSLQLLKALNFT